MWISKKRLDALLEMVEQRAHDRSVQNVNAAFRVLHDNTAKERTATQAELWGLRDDVARELTKLRAEIVVLRDEKAMYDRPPFTGFSLPITVSEVLQVVLDHLKISVVKREPSVAVVEKGGPEKP